MDSNLLLVDRSILPENYLQVIKTRELIEKENLSVSEACKRVGISRNTYYKYKDYVFRPSESLGRKVILSFKALDQKGVLSSLLQEIYTYGGNIITITQEAPIQRIAFILITVNVIDLKITIEDLVGNLKKLEGIKAVNIVAYE